MIFYSGDNQVNTANDPSLQSFDDYLHLAMKEGVLIAASNLAGSFKEVRVSKFPEQSFTAVESTRFDDNDWHHVFLHRRLEIKQNGVAIMHRIEKKVCFILQLSLQVDGVYSDAKKDSTTLQWLYSTIAYVGGKPRHKFIAQILEDSNFIGCLRKVRFTADGRRVDFLTIAKRNDQYVKLDGDKLYIGGWPENQTIFPSVWSKGLGSSFLGCLKDLKINNFVINLGDNVVSRSNNSEVFGRVEVGGCSDEALASACNKTPCQHGGRCVEGFGRSTCDCGHSSFKSGTYCERDAIVIDLNENDRAILAVGISESEAESLLFKFKTRKPACHIFSTGIAASQNDLSRKSKSGFKIGISAGQLEYKIDFGHGEQVFYYGAKLNDDFWHSAKIRRRSVKLEVTIDDSQPSIREILSKNYQSSIVYDSIILNFEETSSSAYSVISSNNRRRKRSSFQNGFKGQLSSIILNNIDLLEKNVAKIRPFKLGSIDKIISEKYNNYRKNAEISESATLTNKQMSYLMLKVDGKAFAMENIELIDSRTFRISFNFKTLELDGLLWICCSGRIAVELIDSQIRLAIREGNYVW
uniref:Uncharacterized protein n=1 Tax=Romanomermis culicivorax TaxID=13658 RepID=A0A915KIA9_ROMCU